MSEIVRTSVDNLPNGCRVEFTHPTRGRVTVTLTMDDGEWPHDAIQRNPDGAFPTMVKWALEVPLPRPR